MTKCCAQLEACVCTKEGKLLLVLCNSRFILFFLPRRKSDPLEIEANLTTEAHKTKGGCSC